MKPFNKPIFQGTEWSFELLEEMWTVIDDIGKNELGLQYYEPQLEIISAEQMLDSYSSVAMPIMYNHWSFGKSFIRNQKAYERGQMGLAYEVVINTNPTLAYLMEDNSMTMQTLVMSHAVCGHGSFFKNNHLFADGVDASGIIDYLKFAKTYIANCEAKYGIKDVQQLLDACHALRNFGVDRFKRAPLDKKDDLKKRKSEWARNIEERYDRILPENTHTQRADVMVDWLQGQIDQDIEPKLPEGNILYFIEKYAPNMQEWQREIVRIVRKVAQYFYPQKQTQLMNEGWATFIHYTIMTILNDRGAIDEGSYLEFLQNHTAVITQPPHRMINVYALGFAMMRDIRRMCEDPTEEDRKWFPDIVDTDWMTTLKEIVVDYRDESFVLQYLSPKVIRDLKLCALYDKEDSKAYTVSHVHDDDDVLTVRKLLAEQYAIANSIPDIEIVEVDWDGDRSMTLHYTVQDKQLLKYKDLHATLEYLRFLWGFKVKIDYFNPDGTQSERTTKLKAEEN
jgi:spore cortex formation protein SpoVR/YcgB (stage V sporulation)